MSDVDKSCDGLTTLMAFIEEIRKKKTIIIKMFFLFCFFFFYFCEQKKPNVTQPSFIEMSTYPSSLIIVFIPMSSLMYCNNAILSVFIINSV